jgi:hypothetical protein
MRKMREKRALASALLLLDEWNFLRPKGRRHHLSFKGPSVVEMSKQEIGKAGKL